MEKQKVLIYRLGSLGDAIVCLPALHQIRRQLPQSEITLLTNFPVHQRAASMASVIPKSLYDHVFEYPVGLRSPLSLLHLRRTLKARRFGLVISLTPPRGAGKSLRDYLFFRSCGIPEVKGIPWPSQERDRALKEGPESYPFEAARLMKRVAWLGEVDLGLDSNWDLQISREEVQTANRLLKQFRVQSPFLVISCGTKSNTNDWTERNWNELIRRLSKEQRMKGLGLVTIGSELDRDRSQRMLDFWTGPIANLCGLVSPRVSGAILKQGIMFVGHDSGPMHLAAAVGTACVAIFSARNPPGEWFPRGNRNRILYHQTPCFGCRLDVCKEFDKKCIQSITVDEVIDGVLGTLGPSGPSRWTEPKELEIHSV
jgi:ADP-heptose:LPS heptosyltransferase